MSIVIGCSCNLGMGNTGEFNCQDLFGLTRGVAVMETIASDLSRNRIDISTAIGTSFSDLLTESDKTKRLFPITGLRNVDYPKEETQYETDNTGQKERIRKGIQSFMAEKWKVSNVFVSKVQQGECGRKSIYYITDNGVVGVKKTEGASTYWYPLEVQAFDADYVPRKGDAVEKMMLGFDQDVNLNVGELWMLTWDDLGIDIEDMVGLFDANFTEVTAPAADTPVLGDTQVEYRLTTDYGSGVADIQNIAGQVVADFQLYNNTTAADITVTAALVVTEVAGTKYTFSYTSQTVADSLTLSFVTASGYEGEVTFVQP